MAAEFGSVDVVASKASKCPQQNFLDAAAAWRRASETDKENDNHQEQKEWEHCG